MPDAKPLRAELERVMRMAPAERGPELLVGLVDSIVSSPRQLPPIPNLALRHSERIAERQRDPKRFTTDNESDARDRLRQWDRWYALISEALLADGIYVLQLLAARGWWNRFEAIAMRTESQVRALRELALPWWPLHRIEEDPYRELSLLDYVEQQLGKLNSASLRRGGAATAAATAVAQDRPPTPRRAVDDWEPAGELL